MDRFVNDMKLVGLVYFRPRLLSCIDWNTWYIDTRNDSTPISHSSKHHYKGMLISVHNARAIQRWLHHSAWSVVGRCGEGQLINTNVLHTSTDIARKYIK